MRVHEKRRGQTTAMGWIEELARRVGREANISAVVNVGKGRGKQSVHARQTIVQRDGRTVSREESVRVDTTPNEESHDREA